jgi:hypothetical protein
MSPDQPVIAEQPLKPGVDTAAPQPAPVVARLPRRRRRILPPLLIALAGFAALGVGVAWWLDIRDYKRPTMPSSMPTWCASPLR